MTQKSPRTVAAELLKRILGSGAYSNIALRDALEHIDGSTADRALCSKIVMTAVERAKTLDYIIAPFCRKKPDPILRGLLYTGTVQILYMDRIPDSAACDETVKAAKELTDENRAKFVNAVLRNICRSKDSIAERLKSAPEDVAYSVDATVLKMLSAQYPDKYKDILDCFFKELPLFVSPNTLKTSAEALASEFTELGCEVGWYDNALYVSSGASKLIPLINNGDFYIQGYASQHAVRLLDAHQGDTVVDVCACPGGKTLGAALGMNNIGTVYAFDIHENKLPLIEKSAALLGVNIIKTAKNDGRAAKTELIGRADRVICDVPCSALGVISTRPEIRYKNVGDLSALINTQYGILSESSKYLKSGGTLVYSTCTFNKNENSEQIKRFISEHDGFTVCEEKQFLPDGMTDGFYCCRMIKNG